MTIAQTTAAVLAAPESHTGADLRGLRKTLGARLNEAGERLRSISVTRDGPGAERRNAMQAGEVQVLAEFDREAEALRHEIETLTNQDHSVGMLLERVEAREAAQAVPKHFSELADALSAAEAARDALATNLVRVQRAFVAASQDRVKAIRGGHAVEGGTIEQLSRIGSLRAWSVRDARLSIFGQSAHDVAESLGIDRTEATAPAQWAAA
jgi:hypothetical protein